VYLIYLKAYDPSKDPVVDAHQISHYSRAP
jgi:hypothetical protein